MKGLKSSKNATKKAQKFLLLVIFFFSVLCISTFIDSSSNNLNIQENKESENSNDLKVPKTSWLWATLDLTNPIEVNNSRFYHNTVIPIKGRIYNRIAGDNKSGVNVMLNVNNVPKPSFTAITNSLGQFQINYTVEYSLDIYASHKINVTVSDSQPGGPGSEIEYHHFYKIYTNATTFIQITSMDDPLTPKLVGENFNINGYLRRDDGTGVNPATIQKYWYNTSYLWNLGTFATNLPGSFSQIIQVPTTLSSKLTLKLNFSSVSPYLNYSEYKVNLNIFSNITCIWDIDTNAAEGADIAIAGQIVSSTDVNVKIGNRQVTLYFAGATASTVLTDGNGFFSIDYTVPIGSGAQLIEVEVANTGGRTLNSTVFINVEAAPVEKVSEVSPKETPAPYSNFLIPFIIIVAGIVSALLIYARYYYRKQEEESRVVAIPLEDKIVNLKILKDSGRLEEAVSYLFNAIFMTLVNGKFNRKKKVNETVRDFAIVSVKDLKMTPTLIYPFMSKVEEIIYNRPQRIIDKDFYDAVTLFSPVYNELTGFNFSLNF